MGDIPYDDAVDDYRRKNPVPAADHLPLPEHTPQYARSREQSRQGSRAASKAASRMTSRPTSKPGSRGGSPKGSRGPSAARTPKGTGDREPINSNQVHVDPTPGGNGKDVGKAAGRDVEADVPMITIANPWDGDGMPGPLEWSGKWAFGGLMIDIKRRMNPKTYLSDYTEAFTNGNFAMVAPATIFLFFACYAPALAFGALFDIATEGQVGIIEMVISTAICGVIYALFSGQPLTIMGATGPELAYTIVFYQVCQQVGLEFLPARWWQGMWTALFTVACAVFDWSALMKYVTIFTEEIFSSIVSVLEIAAALTAIVNIFLSDRTLGTQLFSAILTACTYISCVKFRELRASDWFNKTWRKHISNYGVVIVIFLGTLITNLVIPAMGITDLQFLNVPESVRPTLTLSNGQPRPWVVDPSGIETEFPFWGVFLACPFALGLTILGYLDQNLTEVIVNKKERLFKKSPGYHLDLFVCGAGMYPLLSVLGLPFTHAATVRSLAHVIALTQYETFEDEEGNRDTRIVGIIETRVTHLVVHLFMFVSLALTPLLKLVPQYLIIGIFLYLGMSSIRGNNMFTRMFLFFTFEKDRWPDEDWVEELEERTIHKFTLLQVVCFVIIVLLRYVGAGGAMPFLIAALVPVRLYIVPRLFLPEEIAILDPRK